ncbi:hypothetical protein LCGC14_2914160 [marine sediment metagenome]|uniref:Phage tail collar domain-containing protein n=1 Tax=marine sediment metagenome TaxID=412755 RepID=A0A0F8ZYG1_9ZZZZ
MIGGFFKSGIYKRLFDQGVAEVGVPIGSIQAWHKDLPNTPSLFSNWVQCDGQILNDIDSPYDGETIPDLNGQARFLRGAVSSGVDEAEDFKSHAHNITRDLVGSIGTGAEFAANKGVSDFVGATTVVAGGTETRPINMSVVWIIKVK